jgi:hypothetical protein
MAAVEVSVVALEQSGIVPAAVGPARLPDSGVASTASRPHLLVFSLSAEGEIMHSAWGVSDSSR